MHQMSLQIWLLSSKSRLDLIMCLCKNKSSGRDAAGTTHYRVPAENWEWVAARQGESSDQSLLEETPAQGNVSRWITAYLDESTQRKNAHACCTV